MEEKHKPPKGGTTRTVPPIRTPPGIPAPQPTNSQTTRRTNESSIANKNGDDGQNNGKQKQEEEEIKDESQIRSMENNNTKSEKALPSINLTDTNQQEHLEDESDGQDDLLQDSEFDMGIPGNKNNYQRALPQSSTNDQNTIFKLDSNLTLTKTIPRVSVRSCFVMSTANNKHPESASASARISPMPHTRTQSLQSQDFDKMEVVLRPSSRVSEGPRQDTKVVSTSTATTLQVCLHQGGIQQIGAPSPSLSTLCSKQQDVSPFGSVPSREIVPLPAPREQSLTLRAEKSDITSDQDDFDSVESSHSEYDLEKIASSIDRLTQNQKSDQDIRGTSLLLDDSQQKSNTLKKRIQLPPSLLELVRTEREYTQALVQVVNGYKRKMQQLPEMFSQDTIALLFSNLEEIALLHQKLQRKIAKEISTKAREQECAHLFRGLGQEMQIYAQYCAHYPTATNTLNSLEHNPSTLAFLTGCQYLQSQSLSLSAFLLLPVQRICKYPLLFREWLKVSPYHEVQRAATMFEETVKYVNEYKRLYERRNAVQELSRKIENWPADVSSAHSSSSPPLTNTQAREILSNPSSIPSKIIGWPYSRSPPIFIQSFILYTTSAFDYRSHIPLSSLRLLDPPGRTWGCVRNDKKKKTIWFECPTDHDKEDWINKLSGLLQSGTTMVASNRYMSDSKNGHVDSGIATPDGHESHDNSRVQRIKQKFIR